MADDEAPAYKHRHEMRATGTTDRQIARWVHANEMTQIWRGAYHRGPKLAVWEELRLSALAAAERGSAELVISHAAAAAVHRMGFLNFDWSTVDFTRNGRGGGVKKGRRRVHRRRLDAEDVVVVDGALVTSIARTALDLALDGTFEQAVCALDGALRKGVTRDEIAAGIGRLGRRRGAATMRAALAEASKLSESVGESWSRALMLRWPEIPRPELQHELYNEADALEARVDFLWSGLVVGEFDGKGKQKDGFTSEERIQRDSLLMHRGLKPTHWEWIDCKEPDRLHNKLLDILGPHGLLLAGPSRVRSSLSSPDATRGRSEEPAREERG